MTQIFNIFQSLKYSQVFDVVSNKSWPYFKVVAWKDYKKE